MVLMVSFLPPQARFAALILALLVWCIKPSVPTGKVFQSHEPVFKQWPWHMTPVLYCSPLHTVLSDLISMLLFQISCLHMVKLNKLYLSTTQKVFL